ncbi:IS21 family transposase [Halalkalibacter sp. AB-rgal2]|uniref:IS21 family transposase n=1 Tax=Halalkalibacter sp. AB-rgal2 TaxID=3242695 RepID=UPI00359EAA9C
MLAMPEINHIKKLRNEKSLSINEICRRTGFSWETVKKYADEDQLPSEKIPPKCGMMYTEKWGEIVSDWLMEDLALKKKLRRNNINIFDALKKLGFPGSYRTVCNFVKEWKEKRLDQDDTFKEEYDRLTHPPAEAQIDFGITEVVQDGKVKDIHCLIMSLPFSNGGYTVPLPAENQQCFLEGLKGLFQQLGRVPRKVRIDNLAAAVVRARGKLGDTVFTEGFQLFASHYGFEAEACNAGKGNEKGHVENKVGYIRYNHFTPSPVIRDLKHLQEMLVKKTKEDHKRPHYSKDEKIQDLIEEEKKYCLALPENDYPVFKQETVTANKYGEITVDGELIHIPTSYQYSQLSLMTYWDAYKVISPHGEIVGEGPRPYMNQSRELPWAQVLKMWRSKPRSIAHSRYSPYLPGRIANYLTIDSIPLRKERVEWLLGLIMTYTMNEIDEEFYELLPASDRSAASPEAHPYGVNWHMYDALRPDAPVLGGDPK